MSVRNRLNSVQTAFTPCGETTTCKISFIFKGGYRTGIQINIQPKQSMKILKCGTCLILALFSGSLTSTTHAAILVSNGSQADVQAKINSANNGDTITLPAGSFTWTSGVTSSKAITIAGAGGGRIVARSESNVTVSTGTKTFTLVQESVASIAALRSALSNGSTLKIWRTGGAVSGGTTTGALPWMQGTITSLIGDTLTMNITSTNGDGTHPVWIFATTAPTTIVWNATNATAFNLTESTAKSVELYGIRFEHAAGLSANVNASADFITLNATTNGYPALIHDCSFFDFTYGNQIRAYTSKGVIWNCSFVALPFSFAQLAIHAVNSSYTTSWSTVSTMGEADTTGRANFYVEDCDFHAWNNANDYDENMRSVTRYCLFNQAAWGSHGADSSNYGQRHFEVYNCEFQRTNFSNGQTLNLGWFFLVRGGTGVITNNIIPTSGGSDYGGSPHVKLALWNLQFNGGPNPLWGNNIAGNQYPCPRQIGMGRVTGSGTDGRGRSTDTFAYVGDSEPLYIWGNTGAVSVTVSISQYSTPLAGQDVIADYVIAGRDFFNNGTVKPGYVKKGYPHQLRPGIPPSQASIMISLF